MLIRILFGWKKPQINSLEQRLISALTEKLPSRAAELLDAQLKQINLVQRHCDHKEVNLYARQGNKSKFNEETLFPMRSESRLATITFCCANLGKAITADIWIVEGHIFSIEFDQSPKNCAEARISIGNITIHADPLKPDTALPKNAVATLHGWLNAWREQGLVSQMQEPLPKEKRDRIVKQIEAKLPPDYIGIAAQSEGLIIKDWRVFGLSEIRSVVTTDNNYYFIAEKKGYGIVGVKRFDWSGELHCIEYEGNLDRTVGFSLKEYIEGGDS